MCVCVCQCVCVRVSVFDYGRTRARKTVFRICQKRLEFTNTLASCLRFQILNTAQNFTLDHLFSLFFSSRISTQLWLLFSHTLFTTRREEKRVQPAFSVLFPFCPFSCSFVSHCCCCCWDSLTFRWSESLSLSVTLTLALLHTEFSTRLLRPRRKLFHCCYFFFLSQ